MFLLEVSEGPLVYGLLLSFIRSSIVFFADVVVVVVVEYGRGGAIHSILRNRWLPLRAVMLRAEQSICQFH